MLNTQLLLYLLRALPMPKRNWNDINDSDSSLSSLEEQDEPPPQMIKQVSAPPALTTTSKLKSACDEMSLKKMDKHEGNEVWLYIPNSFYQRCEEVNDILERRTEIKKVIRVKNIGWNVLTSRHMGGILIEEGFSEDNLFIKFIYSNRNEEKSANDDRPKNQKKVTYVQKIIPMEKEQPNQQSRTKVEAREEQKGEKKKVRWVEKSKSMKEESSKEAFQGYEELKSPFKNEASYKSPPKWTAKSPKESEEIRSPKRFIQKKPSKPEEQIAIKPQQKIQSSEIHQKQQSLTPLQPEPSNDTSKVESETQQEIRTQAANDDSSDQSASKQSKKKKKRKSKKSKPSVGPPRKQKDQNPFSFFSK